MRILQQVTFKVDYVFISFSSRIKAPIQKLSKSRAINYLNKVSDQQKLLNVEVDHQN